jgi:hypothetical protein
MVATAHDREPYHVQCDSCMADHVMFVHRQDMLDWMAGTGYIQDLMPYLSASDRELLISKTCGKCFDKMFPPTLDSDDE